MKPLQIAIMGTPVSSNNRGVLALGASLVNLCSTAIYSGEVILMLCHYNNEPVQFRIGGQLRPVQVVNCRLSLSARLCDHLAWIAIASMLYRALPMGALRRALSNFTPWIAALEKADIVGDIRGGDSFSDIYGIPRFLFGFLMAWTALLVKGAIVQFPQTFGPYNNPLARRLARYLLNRSKVVIARDRESQRVATELLSPSRDVWLSPDVAFPLEAVQPDFIVLHPPLKAPVPTNLIGLNVNGLMFNGGYTRNNMFGLKLDYRSFLPALVQALLAEHPGELWLIPHTYGPPDSVESDPEACWQVRRTLPKALHGRVRIVTGDYDQHEIKGVIGQCNFFIGSRMHACIAALSQGVPCVAVAYSMKFSGVLDSVGMHGWVIDGRNKTNVQAVAQTIELYRSRDSVRETLKRNAEQAERQLKHIFERLISATGGISA